MYYVSTRDKSNRRMAAEAIAQGLAADGGLYTPEVFPKLSHNALQSMKDMSYQQRAVYIMNAFLDDYSAAELTAFAKRAYGDGKFDAKEVAPVRQVDQNTYALELWHGPTCAFKDMALQILPHLLTAALKKNAESRTACILTATSGDTGKAALEGFRDVAQTRILVFYPQDGVSQVQKLQMLTQEGENVGVCAVEGNFDDAQTGVKKIFSDPKLRQALDERGYFFSSANSINWGRVLPQIVYYVSAYCDLLRDEKIQPGDTVNVCVPTGNFGDILAGYYAKKMGVPLGRLICASNKNKVLTDFIRTGIYDRDREFYTTISPSMDILISSNLERMLFEFSGCNDAEVRSYMDQLANQGRYEVSDAVKARFADQFSAGFCDDEDTRKTIAKLWSGEHYLADPHTAVAFHVLEEYRKTTQDERPAIVVSTASPFKFSSDVLEAIGVKDPAEGLEAVEQLSEKTGIAPPHSLAALRHRKVRFGQAIAKEQMADQVLGFLK
ncbi:threonine synthase [Pseudoflavonifractor phocaeensis]|uniref:threonine synthase n=1 Tax=Pseudoflavonifractor phocaeensis TaxID=1870988 RepID=UPI00195D677D|nr:threonine synthase [Pseudoflavonifractor phocaeensis]MBM6869608.1 threonine synthase [Pseudoflavonifractor phocaeensis]MBM6938514.1 threonine synthase [Pseudoflavonifractor phocaeensis]